VWEDFETRAQTFHMSRCACVCERDSEREREKVCVFVFVCIYIFSYIQTHMTPIRRTSQQSIANL